MSGLISELIIVEIISFFIFSTFILYFKFLCKYSFLSEIKMTSFFYDSLDKKFAKSKVSLLIFVITIFMYFYYKRRLHHILHFQRYTLYLHPTKIFHYHNFYFVPGKLYLD